MAKSRSVVTQSSAFSTAADTSPAGSIGTHFTWPDSSGGACDEDQAMLDVDDAGEKAQAQQFSSGGLNTESFLNRNSATDRARSPDTNDLTVVRQKSMVSDETSPPTCQSPTGDGNANAKSNAGDDLTHVLDLAMEILSASEETGSKTSEPPTRQDNEQTNPHRAGSPAQVSTHDRPTSIGDAEDTSAEDTLMADDYLLHSSGAYIQATSHMRPTRLRPRVTTVAVEVDQPGHQPDDQSDRQPDSQPDHQSDSQPDSQPDHQPDSQPDSQPDTLYKQFIIDSPNIPILEQDQLGVEMPETLARLTPLSSYGNKARLPWIPQRVSEIDIKESLLPHGDPDVIYNEFTRRDDGSVHIYRDDPADGRELEWPDFENPGRPMTAKEASQALADFLTDPGSGASYYCGLAESELWAWCALYPGRLLANVEGLTHVNEIYTHLGKKNSGTAMHNEDDKLRSVNVAFAGTKLFLLVDEEDTEKFEDWVRANYKCKPCPQFVRHLNIFFNPLQLQAAGIRFKILIQRAGDLIETQRGQYHQVLNIQDSLAISINYLRHSETPNFMDPHDPLEVCDECGLKGLFGRSGFYVKWVDLNVAPPASHRITLSGKGCKRKAASEPLNAASRNTRAYAEASDKFAETRTIIRLGNPSFTIPTHPSLDEQHVLKMAAAVLSPSAIAQFTELVAAWRNRDGQKLITDTGDDGLRQCAEYLKNASSKSLLGKFQLRYARLAIARQIEDDKRVRSQVRLGKKSKAELAKRLGLTADELSLSLDEGRMWNRVCGDFPGMLALIPLNASFPFYLSKKEWKELNSAQLKALRRIFVNCESFEELCRAGEILQDIISRGSELIFSWEEHGYQFSDNCYLARTVERVAD
ncbi:hypothetical protein ACHAO7_011105 [Fusarium culmorum]